MKAVAPEKLQVVSGRNRVLGLAGAGLTIVMFGRSLFDLAKFAYESELYSYILIIPLIIGFLVWEKRKSLSEPRFSSETAPLLIILVGLVMVIGSWIGGGPSNASSRQDHLAWTALAFVIDIVGVIYLFCGRKFLKEVAGPLAFSIFIIPLPTVAEKCLVIWLQNGSAAVAFELFKSWNTPVFYHDLVFQLPTIRIEVAPECSGIRSTVALFLTSFLAAYYFLKKPWKGFVLACTVLPLAMLRNGFRVFTIGELCVYRGPQMIDSYIHHHGGPFFFAISLIPFSILLWALRRTDRSKAEISPLRSALC